MAPVPPPPQLHNTSSALRNWVEPQFKTVLNQFSIVWRPIVTNVNLIMSSWSNQIIASWIKMLMRQTITRKTIKPFQACLRLRNQSSFPASSFSAFFVSSVSLALAEAYSSRMGTKRSLFSVAELWVDPLCNSISYRTPFIRAIYLFHVTFHPLCLNDVQHRIWDRIKQVFDCGTFSLKGPARSCYPNTHEKGAAFCFWH